jgi:hypothetical protein
VADEPTLGEIARGVADLRADLRALRAELVRSDVYSAHRATDELRLKAVESSLTEMQQDRTALRRLIWAAVLTAAGGLVGQLIITAINSKP